MKKYLVMQGEYSDWNIIGYFDNEEEAREYCAIKNSGRKKFFTDSLYVVEVGTLKKLKSNKEIRKYFSSSLFLKNQELEEKGYDMYIGKYKNTTFSINETHWFSISGTFESQEQCNKALYDYYAEYMSYENEYGFEKAVELLSTKIECKKKYRLYK